MKTAKLLGVGMLGLALAVAACGRSPLGQSQQANGARAAARPAAGSVAQVDEARLRSTLAVLTGVNPVAGGGLIPERGTVQGRGMAREHLAAQLAGYGYQVTRHGYRQNGENLVAILPASVKNAPVVVIGAHMDSVRNAGADDNGSGSTAVLEAARVLAQLTERKAELRVCFFDEEELGLVGSYALAKAWKQQGLKVAAVHTVDMIGYDADGDRAIEVEQPDGELWARYNEANRRHNLGFKLVRTSSGDTDHVAFRQSGFASVGLCEEWVSGDTTPHYHRKTDKMDTISFPFVAAGAKLLIAAVGDQLRGVPVTSQAPFVPHERFPGRPHCSPDHHHAEAGEH